MRDILKLFHIFSLLLLLLLCFMSMRWRVYHGIKQKSSFAQSTTTLYRAQAGSVFNRPSQSAFSNWHTFEANVDECQCEHQQWMWLNKIRKSIRWRINWLAVRYVVSHSWGPLRHLSDRNQLANVLYAVLLVAALRLFRYYFLLLSLAGANGFCMRC